LDYSKDANFILKESNENEDEEEPWAATYVNMKEVKTTFMNAVFRLDEEDAHLLARYIVEESNNDYVYCDENN